MRGRTFDSYSCDGDCGGGGGGGSGGVEATGFSGVLQTSEEAQSLQQQEQQLSIPADPREVGCISLCSAIYSRHTSCCPSLSIPNSKPEHLHNGFLCHGSEGPKTGNGNTRIRNNVKKSGVFTSENKQESVQRVIELDEREIQVQVIGSEQLLKKELKGSGGHENGSLSNGTHNLSEEKPQKRKKKFIIILKGLLNKSNKGEKKKQSENISDYKKGSGDSQDKSDLSVNRDKVKKNSLGGKNKSETNLNKIRDSCCVSIGNLKNFKSENSIPTSTNIDSGDNKGSHLASNSSIESCNPYRSRVNSSSYSRRKFTGTTVDTQEQLTLLYYSALTGNTYKETKQNKVVCQVDEVGGFKQGEEKREESIPVPPDVQSTPQDLQGNNLKEDKDNEKEQIKEETDLLACSSSLRSSKSNNSLPSYELEEENHNQDITQDNSPIITPNVLEDKLSVTLVNHNVESENISVNTSNDSHYEILHESSQVDVDESVSSSSSSNHIASAQNTDSSSDNENLHLNLKLDDTLTCDSSKESLDDSGIEYNQNSDSNIFVSSVKIFSDYSENECIRQKQEISEDEVDPWGKESSCDFSSDSDGSDSSSDSSIDYDVPPVDDYIYDLQFDPYFYQGSLSLEDIPDDQPIDYPCPYDDEGRLIKRNIPQYNSHFSYIDNHSYNPITSPGDLYRSQSQPEAISQRLYEDTPLDGNAPLHVFLSQPIPNQVPNYVQRHAQLKPRKRGEFSSLSSFGGSQLYTITEEAEWDPLEEDIYSRRQYSDGEFYTKRNYSESDIYLGYDDSTYDEPYYMNADLYYGDTDTDTDSDETIHSDQSHGCISTETLEKIGDNLRDFDELASDDDIVQTDVIPDIVNETCVSEYPIESPNQKNIAINDSESGGEKENDSYEFQKNDEVLSFYHECEKDLESSYHGDCENVSSEYPDEFILFCSEAEITDMEVMDTVDVLPYNRCKEEFKYFKVEDKTSCVDNSLDQQELPVNNNYSSKSIEGNQIDNPSKTESLMTNNHCWKNHQVDFEKMSPPIYQNIPINSRLSRSNPNLAAFVDEVPNSKPIYQNVPVPSKRFQASSKELSNSFESKTLSDSDDDFDYLNFSKNQYIKGEKDQILSTFDRKSNGLSFHKTNLHEINAKHLSKDDNDVQSTLHKWSSRNCKNGDLSTIVNGNGHSNSRQSWQSLGVKDNSTTSPKEFNAYASNTSLDHDTFFKTSKIYKWNGSSSVSDLTSLSRDLSPTSPGIARTSASTSDLTSIGGGQESLSDDENAKELMSETSYSAWSAKVQNDYDDQEFMMPLNMKNTTSCYSFTPHGKGGSRMMEFYVNNMTSDSDDDDSSCNSSSSSSASSGSHDLEDDDEDNHQQQYRHSMDRTFQVISSTDSVLDTIEEDVEEDSGAESSGHWMFSADSTDTDSVIHVPAVLNLKPTVEPVQEAESTDSDSTLVIDEDDEQEHNDNELSGVTSTGITSPGVTFNGVTFSGVTSTEVGRGNEQEAGVTEGNSHVGAPAIGHQHHRHRRYSSSSASDDDDGNSNALSGSVDPVLLAAEGAAGVKLKNKTPRRCKDSGKGRNNLLPGDALQGTRILRQTNTMLSRTEAAKLFEKHIDDVFDFESLESCESVYGGADEGGYPIQGSVSPHLPGEDVVFNTSATSQPFADASLLEVNHINKENPEEGAVDAGYFNSDQRIELPPGGSTVSPISQDMTPNLENTSEMINDFKNSEFHHVSDTGDSEVLDHTYVIGKTDENEFNVNDVTGVTCALQLGDDDVTSDVTVIEKRDSHNIVTNDPFSQSSDEPVSMDMFGLPVRWTEDKEKRIVDEKTDMSGYTCQIQKLCKTNLKPLSNRFDSENDLENDNIIIDNELRKENDFNQELDHVTEKISVGEIKDSNYYLSENEKENVTEGDLTSSLTLTVCETPHDKSTTGNLHHTSVCHSEISTNSDTVDEGESQEGLLRDFSTEEKLDKRESHGGDIKTINMRDHHSGSQSNESHSHLNASSLINGSVNEMQQMQGGQPQYVKIQSDVDCSHYYQREIEKDVICDQQQHHPTTIRGVQYRTNIPSGDSDTDTDNTDGDYDEEDHFAAELSLRISTVHSGTHGIIKERNADILSVLTATGGQEGAEHEDAHGSVSPLASQEGSSPEMPDSLRSIEGRNGTTRSLETLSEDSGLGDRDVRLTPSSPLPSISEGGTRGTSSSQVTEHILSSVTARPRRQDIRQARIARARSCGDLRAYSVSSETDSEEESDMNGWHYQQRVGMGSATSNNDLNLNNGMHVDMPFKSSYANYLEQSYRDDFKEGETGHPYNPYPIEISSPNYQHHQHQPHLIRGSDGNEGIKSRYRRVREASNSNHSKPRRYKSLLDFPSRDDYGNALSATDSVPRNGGGWGSRRRPQPISVDLAEEFLNQERFGTLTSKETERNYQNKDRTLLIDNKSFGDNDSQAHPLHTLKEGGGGEEASYHMPLTNQIARNNSKTNGIDGGGALTQRPMGSRGEEGMCKDEESTTDVRVQCGWPHTTTPTTNVTVPTVPYPHHEFDALPNKHPHPYPSTHQQPHPNSSSSSERHPQHQYSSSSSMPTQLPNECQAVHTGIRDNTFKVPTHDPFAHSDPFTFTTHQQQQSPQLQLQQLENISQTRPNEVIKTNQEDIMSEVPVRVRTKTYGSHGEVEVYLARADSGRPPPPHPVTAPAPSPVLTPTGGAEHRTGTKGVTFAPSVKEINWRESYYDVEDGQEVRRQLVESTCQQQQHQQHQQQQQQHHQQQQQHNKPLQNRMEGVGISSNLEQQRPSTVDSVPVANNTLNVNNNNTKINGREIDRSPSSAGSSSEPECAMDDKQQKASSTPIWQRFKLPRITSPKTRPKLLPKPKNLSPRSSDSESQRPSVSPPSPPDSSSSTPSSPDSSKLKKTPSSPKFFSWGSKREKKTREITRPTSAPPPVPSPTQVSSGQHQQQQQGQVVALDGGQTGKPDSPPSVSLTALHREVRNDVPLLISVQKKITSDSSEDDNCVRSALVAKQKNYPQSVTSGSSDSPKSGKERESGSVSSSGDDTRGSSSPALSSGPRSAVAKPPLPPHLQRPSQQSFHKARLLSARRHYFSQERQVPVTERVSPPKDTDAPDGVPRSSHPSNHKDPKVTSVEKKTITSSLSVPPPQPKSSLLTKGSFDSSKDLKERFERFSANTKAERERLARSTPDLSLIRASVRRPNPPRIDSRTGGVAGDQQQQHSTSVSSSSEADNIHVGSASSPASASDGDTSDSTYTQQGVSHSQSNKPRQAIHERYKNRAQRIYARSRTQSTGVLETDLDTGASREYLTLRETNLDDLYKDLQHLLDAIPSVGGHPPTSSSSSETKVRAKSLLDLDAADMEGQLEAPSRPPDTRAKSMEFLLDDGNKAAVQPPENELMKGSERQLSEAELRVRRSLQRLDVPEWMKNAQPAQQGFLLRRRDYGSSSGGGGGGGWSAYSSKTASMTSLGSSRAHTPNTPTKVVIPTRVASSKGTSGIGGITSPASNASISPSPSDRSGSLFQYPISRWSTSRLNSGTTTPTGSVTSTRTTPATYVRQPYLGWRSQTSLASLGGSQSSLTNTGSYLTAADRLALGITSYSQRYVKTTVSTQDKENSSAQANTPSNKSDNEETKETNTNGNSKLQVPADVADVHSSIKEVTSAIVHYCNESTPSPKASPRGSPRLEGPRAPSPRRLVWVESSFVGSRPITSPETPTSSTCAITPTSQLNGHEEPESNEAPSQPPQPPGEYLLAW